MSDAVPLYAPPPKSAAAAKSTAATQLTLKSLALVFLLFLVVTSRTFTASVFPGRFDTQCKIAPGVALVHALAFVILYALMTAAISAGIF